MPVRSSSFKTGVLHELAIGNVSNFYATDQVVLFAALAIAALPPFLVFVVLQQSFTDGLTVVASRYEVTMPLPLLDARAQVGTATTRRSTRPRRRDRDANARCCSKAAGQMTLQADELLQLDRR
jgi:hypothetical protein